MSVSDSLHTHSLSPLNFTPSQLTTKHTLKRRDNRIVDCFFIPNELPKKSSKEDPFCDFTDGTYTFAVFVVVENTNSVFTEYNSELASFDELTGQIPERRDSLRQEILFFLRGCDFVVVVVILRVVVSCGVLTLWCVQKEKEKRLQSVKGLDERERESRETERKILKKKEQRAFGFVLLCFFCVTNRLRSVISSHENKNVCLWEPLGRRAATSTEEEASRSRFTRWISDPEDNTRDQSRASHLVRSDAIGTCSELPVSPYSRLRGAPSCISEGDAGGAQQSHSRCGLSHSRCTKTRDLRGRPRDRVRLANIARHLFRVLLRDFNRASTGCSSS